EGVEAVVERVELGVGGAVLEHPPVPEVPLPDERRLVPRVPQRLRRRRDAVREAAVQVRGEEGAEEGVVAAAEGVEPGEEGEPGGGADGAAGVEVGEAEAARGERV